jgi:hypothetical protein
MTRFLLILTIGSLLLVGCGAPHFAAATSTGRRPAVDARRAVELAIDQLGETEPKALLYAAWFPAEPASQPAAASGPATAPTTAPALPAIDTHAEAQAVLAISEIARRFNIPAVGLRAQSLAGRDVITIGGVSALAIGAPAEVRAAAVPIEPDRRQTAHKLSAALADVPNLKLLMVLGEMSLCFQPADDFDANAFTAALEHTLPRNTLIAGGNSMNDPTATGLAGLAGAVYLDDKILPGHVVGLAIGGEFRLFTASGHAYDAVGPTVTVTKAIGPWVIELDSKPAAEVYRDIAAMAPDEPFSVDWNHPVGLVTSAEEAVPVAIINWIGPEGFDRTGRDLPIPAGALRFGQAIPESTALRILRGGLNQPAICASASQAVTDTLAQARVAGAQPLALLVTSCCTRGMRLADLAVEAEAISCAAAHTEPPLPLFGFYAFGQLGPLDGAYQKLHHRFQQQVVQAILIASP